MAETKRVMDVAKPGSAAASPTSRPVIIGHGPMMKDPMVTPDAENNDMDMDKADTSRKAKDEASTDAQLHGKTIQPDANATEAESSELPEPAESNSVDDAPEQAVADEDTDIDITNEAVVDAVVGQAGQKKHPEVSEEEKAEQARLQQLIADKTYALPIGAITKRRNRKIVLVFVVIVLMLLLVLNFVLDAQLITAPGIPHTNIIP